MQYLEIKDPNPVSETQRSKSHVRIIAVIAICLVLAGLGIFASHSHQRHSNLTSRIVVLDDHNTGSLSFGQGDVCVPATNGYANIIVPAAGEISGMTFYYQDGHLDNCGGQSEYCKGKWGGEKSVADPDGKLNIWVTRDAANPHNGSILYPTSQTKGYSPPDKRGFYKIAGYDADADIITFKGPSYAVEQFERLRVYFGEVLFDIDGDRLGRTCAGVVLIYNSSSVDVSYLSMPELGPQWDSIPSEICVNEQYRGRRYREKGYFHGVFNGKPQWYYPRLKYYLMFDGRTWVYGEKNVSPLTRCRSVMDDPFVCVWDAYLTEVAPFPCQ